MASSACTMKTKREENHHKKAKPEVKPVQSAAAAINFNKYPIKFGDRQFMHLGEEWITSKNLGHLGAC
jgi:hypothetical protein